MARALDLYESASPLRRKDHEGPSGKSGVQVLIELDVVKGKGCQAFVSW